MIVNKANSNVNYVISMKKLNMLILVISICAFLEAMNETELHVDRNKITLHLYTRSRNTQTSVSDFQKTNMLSNYTKIIIHGWITNSNIDWINNMRRSFLIKYSYNVITLDWSNYALSFNYPAVCTQVREIGNLLGDFIVDIAGNNSKNLRKVHIIGHSMGAHLAGYAGKRVYKKTNKKIGRITGLDACKPLYEIASEDHKLQGDDAIMVDTIHTDGGILGISSSYGTADYFPNGGHSFQPGCLDENCGDFNEEQGERFHQDVRVMEERYQGRWDVNMLADYYGLVLVLKRDFQDVKHAQKSLKKPFLSQ